MTGSRPEAPGDAALEVSLRDDIVAHGPITFVRFMERALYDPAHGYYATSALRPTRAGDFLTAAELHPVFGRTLAVQIDEMWRRLGRPRDIVLREYGAGTGSLFLAIVDGLTRLDSELASTVRYDPIDFGRQRAVIGDRLAAAGRAGQLVDAAEDRVDSMIVVANEFVDALPVHRLIQMDGVLREIHVDWRDEKLTEVAGPLTDERLARWFADARIQLADGQRAEVNLAMLDWVTALAGAFERGYVIVIDYGAGSRELYDPERRPTGTLRAFSGQRVSSDVLSEPGERDITSHVDFDALERRARACGFEICGRRRSNEFLLAAGLDAAYEQARAEADADWDAAVLLRSAIQRLLDPNALGGYFVEILARNAPLEPPLRGFAALPPKR